MAPATLPSMENPPGGSRGPFSIGAGGAKFYRKQIGDLFNYSTQKLAFSY